MTSAEMPTRLAMPMPFASGKSATRAAIGSASSNNLNYVDGFPSVYSSPASEGGKYVSRGEMNAIGNMASNDVHFFKCGGINTYDASFAAAIGGYPKGAVLKYLYNGWLYDVISLVDNNRYNVAESGPDDVNWAYLSVPDKQTEEDVFFEGGTGSALGKTVLGIVQAKKTGGLIINASLSPVVGSLIDTVSYPGAFDRPTGAVLIIKELSSATQKFSIPSYTKSSTDIVPADTDGWLVLSGSYIIYWSTASASNFYFYPLLSSNMGAVTKGKYYVVALMVGYGIGYGTNPTTKTVSFRAYESVSGTLKIVYS